VVYVDTCFGSGHRTSRTIDSILEDLHMYALKLHGKPD